MSEKFLLDDNGIKRFLVTINVNGIDYTKMVKANALLVNFLRDDLELTGTKRGCELGDCGSCTVLVNGKPVNSCLILAVEADGAKVVTVEGVSATDNLDIVQDKFLEYGAVQCGYCSPGMIMSAKALLMNNSNPTWDDVAEGISGNICRCTGYVNIIKAILAASGQDIPHEEEH